MQRSVSAVSPSGPAPTDRKAGRMTVVAVASTWNTTLEEDRRPVQRSAMTDWRPQDPRRRSEGEGARIHIRTGEHPAMVVLALCLFRCRGAMLMVTICLT